MTEQSYQVPVVAPDLRHEETIRQICDSLDYLDKVASDIFKRISSRVSDNHTRLKSINDRVNLAQAKIDKIKCSNKATKVFSSAKYPASGDSQDEYGSIFKDEGTLREPRHANYHLQGKHQPVDDQMLKEKLQFYNVHLNIKRNGGKDDGSHGEGLGRLPGHISSVGSLLLFNTSENL